jgi:hypothetical protein
MNPTPNEATKDLERLLNAALARAQHAGIAATLDKPAVERLRDEQVAEAKAALLAAIGKLVSSTQPDDQTTRNVAGILERAGESPEDALRLARHGVAQSQDAQPVAWLWTNPDGSKECSFVPPEQDPDMSTMLALELGREATPLYTHPPIPQEGKVMEALRQAQIAMEHARDYIGDDGVFGPPSVYTDCVAAIDLTTEALALLRSQVQGGLSTNNEEMK